jgi:inhibitor of KinA
VEASDRALLVVLGDEINLAVHRNVAAIFRALTKTPLPGVVNIHPAYASILVVFDPVAASHNAVKKVVESFMVDMKKAEHVVPPRAVEIPVCYGGEFGPDLADCADILEISEDEIITMHSREPFTVFFIGFSPGFPYLGILPSELKLPRLASPRSNVAPGSVGIAGRQTGIYPGATPGGWRIIGRTPISLFNSELEPFSLLNIGDSVRFVPITREDFLGQRGKGPNF